MDGSSGEWTKAARYAELSKGEAGHGPELAEQFKGVFDWHLWLDLEEIFPDSGGRLD